MTPRFTPPTLTVHVELELAGDGSGGVGRDALVLRRVGDAGADHFEAASPGQDPHVRLAVQTQLPVVLSEAKAFRCGSMLSVGTTLACPICVVRCKSHHDDVLNKTICMASISPSRFCERSSETRPFFRSNEHQEHAHFEPDNFRSWNPTGRTVDELRSSRDGGQVLPRHVVLVDGRWHCNAHEFGLTTVALKAYREVIRNGKESNFYL